MFRTSLLATAVVGLVLQPSASGRPAAVTNQPVRVVRPHHPVTLPAAPVVTGSDSCTTPDIVVGPGPFFFNTAAATTGQEGQSEPLCSFGTIANDLWFKWTAPFTGHVDITTCGGAGGSDTIIAVYPGSTCPASGSALACNDDSACGLESTVGFAATGGNTYLIQLGEFPSGTGPMSGHFFLTLVPPPGANDDCATPTVIHGGGNFPFDNSSLTTGSQGQNNLCTGTIDNDQWWTWTASSGGTATVSTCTGISPAAPGVDTTIAIYDGAGCPVGPEIACNGDDPSCTSGLASTVSFPTVCGRTYTIQIGRTPGSLATFGTFNISQSGTFCPLPFCFGDGSGTPCPCGNFAAAGNGCPSSVNPSGANLATIGHSAIANDTLVLHGTGMPNATCLYYQGTADFSVAFGDGLRCVGGIVTRLSTKTNVGGASQYPAAGDASIHVKGNVLSPTTRRYQVWYRNAATFCTVSTFNTTNAVLVTWQ